MAVAFFSIAESYNKFHRRPFLSALAKELAKRGQSTLYFHRPQWLLKMLLKPVGEKGTCDGILIYRLWTLLPVSWCFSSRLLMYLFVSLPVRWQVYRRIKITGEKKHLAWLYKPDQYLYLRHLGIAYAYTHYDNYDDDKEYQFSRRSNYASTLSACVQNSISTFATSTRLVSRLANPDKVKYLGNAIDESLLQTNQGAGSTKPKPVIGFVGAIDQTTDAELVSKLCEAFPECDIQMIGAVHNDEINALAQKANNLTLIGRVDYQKLIDFVGLFDVGICPYAESPFNAYRNPLKLYEYCAFGLPAVSTGCDFDPVGRELVDICNSEAEFIAATRRALSEGESSKKQKRIDFAKSNTWQKRACYVLDYLNIK
ncbi:glycosyltransferase [Corallincola luteus]|uniref:Glycosyltransferase n=1 Tax=Corallincola luteus TaxID=1775177 RepID=A0ABY2AIP5_9GAMM|nr:glycosyltransferase [Corallincola luteus]TCI02611.1 glycosyltransferase [Corallincola luteus]